MLVKHLSLSLAAVLAVTMLADQADAGQRRRFYRVVPQDHYYAGPAFVQRVPGLRVFLGDYALSEDEFDALYGDERQFDESYYEPEPAPPLKPRAKKVAKVPAKPVQQDAGAPATATQKAAGAAKSDIEPTTSGGQPPAAKSAAVGCDKAGSIISGYGFSNVKPQSCTGKLYAFNAVRDGRNFAIKLDPRSGELTEVKKLN